MIVVVLGTMFLDFRRLVEAADAYARDSGEQVVIQLGMSPQRPKHAAYVDFLPHDDLLELQRHARVIVAHAGIGAVRDALTLRKPLLVAPRLKTFGEHMNDHQVDIAEAVERRGWGRLIVNLDQLPDMLAHPPAPPAHYQPDSDHLLAAVRGFVDTVAARKRP
jgi:UDP-N-acetylglucosamine transferase subunit ALG13